MENCNTTLDNRWMMKKTFDFNKEDSVLVNYGGQKFEAVIVQVPGERQEGHFSYGVRRTDGTRTIRLHSLGGLLDVQEGLWVSPMNMTQLYKELAYDPSQQLDEEDDI